MPKLLSDGWLATAVIQLIKPTLLTFGLFALRFRLHVVYIKAI